MTRDEVKSWMEKRLAQEIAEKGPKNTSYIDALRINEAGEIVLVQAHGNATDVRNNRVTVFEENNVPKATIKRLAKDRTRVING